MRQGAKRPVSAGVTRKRAQEMQIALFAGFLIMGGWILLRATPALAVTCLSSVYNTTDEASADGRGNRVQNPGMHIYNDNVDCGRVSSLFVKNATETKFVEVGWFEDPSESNFDYTCLNNTSGQPKLFAYVDTGSGHACNTAGELSTGDDAFTEQDQNQDGIWKFGHAGSDFYTSPNLGSFNSGLLRTNGERAGGGNEPARSEFNGLDREDQFNNWPSWQNTFEASTSDDPGFHDCIDNDHHVRVIDDSNTC
jgi:hypothetical protein